MVEYLKRPDEGFFFNLTYMPKENDEGTTFLDQQELLLVEKEREVSKDLPTKEERVSYLHNTLGGIRLHKDQRQKQEAWINQLSKFKELKQQKHLLARRDFII